MTKQKTTQHHIISPVVRFTKDRKRSRSYDRFSIYRLLYVIFISHVISTRDTHIIPVYLRRLLLSTWITNDDTAGFINQMKN
jgi:hypothetical protein